MSGKISYEQACTLMSVDIVRGDIVWLPRDRSHFKCAQAHRAWNTRYAFKPAFASFCGSGYLQGSIYNKKYLAHRVIWLFANKEWPNFFIDHINGVKSDNRISNLRSVTCAENMRNARMCSANTSGVMGVHWHSAKSKWHATIGVSGKMKHLGYFDEFEAAVARRKAAEIEEGFHPNHGRAA